MSWFTSKTLIAVFFKKNTSCFLCIQNMLNRPTVSLEKPLIIWTDQSKMTFVFILFNLKAILDAIGSSFYDFVRIQAEANVLNLPVFYLFVDVVIFTCFLSRRCHHRHQCDLYLSTLCGYNVPASDAALWFHHHIYNPSIDHMEIQVLLQRPDPSCVKPQQCWQCHCSVQPKLQSQHRVCRQRQDRSHSRFQTNGRHTWEGVSGPSDKHHK